MARRSYTSTRKQDAPTVNVEFELDGVAFVGDGQMSLMDLSELARLANEGMDSGGPEGVAILADIYRTLLGPATYKAFRAHCREHGTDGEVLVEILAGVIAEESDRPTSRPSGSPDGPPPAGTTARVVSLQRGTVEQVPAPILQPEAPSEPEAPQVRSYG
jgi:hypothetical protein